ncbi:MnhB domain-containing protein [Allokutzneria oryzae]|uniref:MnhB domain-containing protein n=1 Tax=Allokutzneria oryzae TaxID=1378989 RepID=A0ABV6A2Y2_9PSEU
MSREPWWEWDAPRERWLLTERDCNGWPRSLLLEVCARIVFPTVLLLSVYLLFAGHNNSGGGFTGGLVAGLAFVLRYLAGGRVELTAVVRVRPPVLIGTGLSIAVVTALAPALVGLPVLATDLWTFALPLVGEVKLATSLFLDVGVYLLIVGVVVDLLGTLGVSLEEDR